MLWWQGWDIFAQKNRKKRPLLGLQQKFNLMDNTEVLPDFPRAIRDSSHLSRLNNDSQCYSKRLQVQIHCENDFLTFKTHVESELLPVTPRGQMYESVSSVHTTTLVTSHLTVTSGKDNMLSFHTFSYGYCRHTEAWITSTIQGQLTTVTRHNVNRQKLSGLYIYCDFFTYHKITSPKAARKKTTAVQTHLQLAFINPLIIRSASQSYQCSTSKHKLNFYIYPHVHILTSPW